jgi:hypothetical protein
MIHFSFVIDEILEGSFDIISAKYLLDGDSFFAIFFENFPGLNIIYITISFSSFE